ncbi:hypothetical protein LTR86_004477 [Recurvomyces mirabilis]|nr:hypothetical protein LTR86_004477 [Recurvomyces mirabilis]
MLAKEIGDPRKVHFTVKDTQDDRPRGWGRIELTETTSPLKCALFFTDDAAEMTIQVIYHVMKSAFDCDGYTELRLHMSKLASMPGCEHKVFGFGLVNVLRNQHLDRTQSSTTDVYTATVQQWRILKSCIEAWLSSLGGPGL